MLDKLELYEVQDKVRLTGEINEIVDAHNALEAKFNEHLEGHKVHAKYDPAGGPKPSKKK